MAPTILCKKNMLGPLLKQLGKISNYPRGLPRGCGFKAQLMMKRHRLRKLNLTVRLGGSNEPQTTFEGASKKVGIFFGVVVRVLKYFGVSAGTLISGKYHFYEALLRSNPKSM